MASVPASTCVFTGAMTSICARVSVEGVAFVTSRLSGVTFNASIARRSRLILTVLSEPASLGNEVSVKGVDSSTPSAQPAAPLSKPATSNIPLRFVIVVGVSAKQGPRIHRGAELARWSDQEFGEWALAAGRLAKGFLGKPKRVQHS